ncbi:sorting nexin-1-like [Octopus sinensis]|uniref:Sorting nexin-1-like n=1 Tax=Octopus sinensis TaxID=2607531 RepID=A0A7E6EJ20_9MOLL|nr:sorting nexin-1-like [Octopus sinensis]
MSDIVDYSEENGIDFDLPELSGEITVERRFSDFIGLYERLHEKVSHYGFFLPLPPEKDATSFNPIFTRQATGQTGKSQRRVGRGNLECSLQAKTAKNIAQRDFDSISNNIKKEMAIFDKKNDGYFRGSMVEYLRSLLSNQTKITSIWEGFQDVIDEL